MPAYHRPNARALVFGSAWRSPPPFWRGVPVTPRPEHDQECLGCHHPYGLHARSHDGTRDGCLSLSTDQTDPALLEARCRCTGFAVRYNGG